MTAEQTLIERIRANWPEELLAMPNWTQWFPVQKPEPGFSGKVPLSSVNRPDTWFTFEDALTKSWKKNAGVWVREEDSPLRPGRGLGFQFFGTDLLPIDLDHIIGKNGTMCSEAMILVSKLMTLTEYSVSGTGLHCIGRGKIRQEVVATQHIQFWNPAKGQKRFFTVTGDLYNEAFATLNDCGEAFQMYASHPRLFSVKMQEELLKIDPEQAASLPPEPDAPQEQMPKERSKTKSRKVHPDFDIYDYLKFNKIPIIKEQDNEPGHCIFVGTCPNHGGTAHAGHNDTTANYIYPCTDGGLAYHCHSSGCRDGQFPIAAAITKLAELHGPYPKKIYEEKSKPKRKLFSVKASEVEMEVIPWLWPGRVPLGRTFIATGEPGLGKSQWTVDFVASLTKGRDFAHGEKNPHPPMEVLMMSSEDGYKDVMVPRLIVAGADLSKIHFILKADDGQFALDSHIEALHEWLEEHPVRLVVIDPLASYFGHKDMMHGQEVRDVLDPLNALAEEMNFTALPVAHGPKSATTAINKVAGSMQLIAAARAGFLFERDTVNKKHVLMLPIKENLATGKGLKFEIVRADHPLMPAGAEREGDWKAGIGKLVWLGETEKTANEVLEEKQSSDFGVKNKIRKWLQEMLANGPVSTAQAGEEMNTRGFSMSTVRDVCREMQVVRDGKTWSIKKKPQSVQTEFDLNKEKTV